MIRLAVAMIEWCKLMEQAVALYGALDRNIDPALFAVVLTYVLRSVYSKLVLLFPVRALMTTVTALPSAKRSRYMTPLIR